MRQILKIFFKAEGTHPFLVLTCLLIGGTLEAIGVGSLLPLVGTLIDSGKGAPTVFETYYRAIAESIGLNSNFNTLLLVAVAFMVIRSVLLFGAASYASVTGARVANNLRKRLIKAIFDARWSYYANQSSGRIASVISNDATRASDAYYLCAVAATSSLQILAYSVVAFLINWKVALLAIFGGGLIALASGRLVRVAKSAGYKQIDRTAMLTEDMVDMVQNIKSLKSMHLYDPLIDRLTTLIKRLRRSLYTQNFAKSGLSYGNDVLMVLIIATAAWLAVGIGQIPVSQLLVIGILFFQVISYLTKFMKNLQTAGLYEAAYVRTLEMITEAESQKELPFGKTKPASYVDCRVEHVSFSHGEKPAFKPVLSDVSLVIPARKVTVLQGASGAGKTTLIDLLIGLHEPQSGTIRIGKDLLRDLDIIAWRQKIGYVPQELTLIHDSIRQNVSLSAPNISDDDIRDALSLAGADDFLRESPHGLDSDVGELGGKLSGGQRQRISLARALVRKPEVLILDEVTSALDPETEAAIVERIAALRGRYTIVAITHRPAWTAIADRLYTFAEGRVTETRTRPSARRRSKK